MICDHSTTILEGKCKFTVTRAPRVVVPPRGTGSEFVSPLRMFTTMHFCEIHKGQAKIGDLLTARVKRDFEQDASRRWPLGIRCDFDKAHVEYILTTTPEYRRFLKALGQGGILRAAVGAAKVAG